MFDWMSLSTFDHKAREIVESFCCKNNVTLVTKVSQEGEILESGKQVGSYKGIKLIILNNGIIKLMFSVHKLYNELHSIKNYRGEAMNHDTFDIHKMKYVINWLEFNFGLVPSTTKINQLEFGFNLTNLSVDTSFVLQNLISFKGRCFNSMKTLGSGNGREVPLSQYRIKFYDKALQNNLPYRILRIEYKATKMQPIQRLFFKEPSLNQLLQLEVWQKCKKHLIDQIAVTIICDEIIGADLIPPLKVMQFLSSWSNPRFWESCKADKRSKNKKELDVLLLNHGVHQLKPSLIKAIDDEYSRMITIKKAMILPSNIR